MPVTVVEVGGHQLEVTHAEDASEVEQILHDFRSSIGYVSSFIGLDIEFAIPDQNSMETKIASICLCNGYQCLVVNMTNGDFRYLPTELIKFMRDAGAVFVGMGIKDIVTRMKKEYGVWCRSIVELGEMAVRMRNQPALAYCGVYELASRILEPHKPRARVFDELQAGFRYVWTGENAIFNAYMFWKIAYGLYR